MITLAADCLVFQLASGERVPFSSDMVSVDLLGDTAHRFDPEFVLDATKAVFHYFKHEKGRQSVSVGEFAEALEQVLCGFQTIEPKPAPVQQESDLHRLARESGLGCELFFFARLRDELRGQVQQNPGLVRFSGLRDCVKELLGAQRWGERCRSLEEQIVSYLQECLTAEPLCGQVHGRVERGVRIGVSGVVVGGVPGVPVGGGHAPLHPGRRGRSLPLSDSARSMARAGPGPGQIHGPEHPPQQ